MDGKSFFNAKAVGVVKAHYQFAVTSQLTPTERYFCLQYIAVDFSRMSDLDLFAIRKPGNERGVSVGVVGL